MRTMAPPLPASCILGAAAMTVFQTPVRSCQQNRNRFSGLQPCSRHHLPTILEMRPRVAACGDWQSHTGLRELWAPTQDGLEHLPGRQVPLRCTSMTVLDCSSDPSQSRFQLSTPARATTPSSRPNRSIPSATTFCSADRSRTSSSHPKISRPIAWTATPVPVRSPGCEQTYVPNPFDTHAQHDSTALLSTGRIYFAGQPKESQQQSPVDLVVVRFGEAAMAL